MEHEGLGVEVTSYDLTAWDLLRLGQGLTKDLKAQSSIYHTT